VKEKLKRIWAYVSDAGRVKRFASYVLVAAAASALTVAVLLPTVARKMALSNNKLTILSALIEERYIGDADMTKVEDAAAHAMISATGDRWSFYIPASEMGAYMEQKENAYVGIGITITRQEDDSGIYISAVTPGGSAEEAGILAGDVIVAVDGQSSSEIGFDAMSDLIRGEEGTQVTLTILRDGTQQDIVVTRKRIQTPVAIGTLLEGNIGLVEIVNFNANCAKETVAAIEALRQQGAEKLIFDVRFNPGGYAHEMVELLDYLLPEGDLFRTVEYTGKESVEKSDASCLNMPMMVLVNGSSYSAAEFFAAALEEYGAAKIVGEQTSGKGFYQVTYTLPDGSGVALSIGKYYTPNGKCLEGIGLTPNVVVPVDEATAAAIYAGTLDPAADPQIQKAIAVLNQQ